MFKKPFEIEILTKLKMSFATILCLTFLIGIVSYLNITQLSTLIEKIYNHPFIVSNTVQEINSNIIAMHRAMKDVTLSKNSNEMNHYIRKVDNLEQTVLEKFDLVSKHFLGNKDDVKEKYDLFIKWKIIRSEIINLAKTGKEIEAAEITKNKGARYVQNLNDQIQLLINSSNNNAYDFFINAQEKKSTTVYILTVFTIIVLILTLIVAKIIIDGLHKSMSESKRLNENIQNQKIELENLLSSFDKHVIASNTDKKGFITYVSEAFCKISGFTEEELMGKQHNIVRHPDMSKELYKDLWHTIKADKQWQGEIKNKKKDGGYYWVEVIITPQHDILGKINGYNAIRHDITNKKKVEELKNNLEDEVIKRTQDLNNTNKKLTTTLNDLIETKKDLISAEKMAILGELVGSITHEINSPLGVSITTASFLRDITEKIETSYKNEEMTEEQFLKFIYDVKEVAKILSLNLNNTEHLVKSFKNVAVDQATEEKREFDIKKYISEILLALKSKIKKTKINILVHCDDNIILNNYPGYFSQILTNLINNSILHGFEKNEKGEINITVNDLNENIELIYGDNGKGVPQNSLHKIFEEYYTTKKEKGGTGLGLYIIKKILTEKLNGTIKVNTLEEKGLEFIITVPKNVIEEN